MRFTFLLAKSNFHRQESLLKYMCVCYAIIDSLCNNNRLYFYELLEFKIKIFSSN